MNKPPPPSSTRRPGRAYAGLLLAMLVGLLSSAAASAPLQSASVGTWLARYAQLAQRAPPGCPDVRLPRPPADLPAKAFPLPQLAGASSEQPFIVYSRDPVVERLIVLARDADGCLHAGQSGKAIAFDDRAIKSPLPNIRIPARLGDTPPVAIVADGKSIRPWIAVATESEFHDRAARSWVWIGTYTGILTVLLLIGLGFAIAQRSRLALAYAAFVLTLQLYQLQAFGLGPAWLPFWPGPEHARGMQALTTALMLPALAAVFIEFMNLSDRRLRTIIVAAVGIAAVLFASGIWSDLGYRLGAAVLTLLAPLIILLLARQLRSENLAVRWLAVGLGASMIGGSLQAIAMLASGSGLPPISAHAFPIANLIESICWIIAVSLRLREAQQSSCEQLIHAASHDALTGTRNRAFVCARVRDALARVKASQGKAWLLVVDLDGFHQINSALGHSFGDKVLRTVATALIDLKLGSEVIGRFGGDRFVMIRHDAYKSITTGAAAAVVARLKESLDIEGRQVHVRASVGFVEITREYDSADHVIRDAEAAVAHAKRRGGGRFAEFDDSMREHLVERQRTRMELANAGARRELLLHYQPIFDLGTMRPKGFEALLRWQHPQRGLLPASDFVPIAARCGLLTEIGAEVIDRAFIQIHEWQRAGLWQPGGFVSINLSQQELVSTGLSDYLDRALDHYPIDPASIRLEIPEAALSLQPAGDLADALRRLSGRGLLLALDDFGTGLSPIAPPANFEFDMIKLHASVVSGVQHRAKSQMLARISLLVGQELGSLVIAQGVETRDQLEQLQLMGFGYAQGRMLAAPMPADEVVGWLEMQQRDISLGVDVTTRDVLH